MAVGTDEVALLRGAEQVVERKVKLPMRWLKGFVEVQAYQSRMERRGHLGKVDTLRFLRSLPRTTMAKTVYWIVPAGNGLRLSQRESESSLRVAGIERLRLLDDLAPLADGLSVFADSRGDASEWQLRFGPLTFHLTISAEVRRGFSGEGQVLADLAAKERDRLLWQKSGLEMDEHEQVLALVRLAPEGREKALKAAKDLSGEPGQTLQFALGQEHRVGSNAALWLAACRSRKPHGDLPEFEAKHPRLGPDAGVGAQYSWNAGSERREFVGHAWTNLQFELTTQPSFPMKVDNTLLPVLFHGPWQTGEEGEKSMIRWAAQLWPANREATLAFACKRLEASVGYADVNDREYCAYVEPLAEPHTELRPMACLALTLCLAAQDSALRGQSQEGLIAAIGEGRLNLDELGGAMARLLDTGINKFARWAKSLTEVARVSSAHTRAVADLLARALHGDPAKAPRDIGALLELLFELLSETDRRLNDSVARTYIAALPFGGKTAKLGKQILG